MREGIFLRLNDKFALGAADLQWILYRKGKLDAEESDLRDWRGISFIHSTKTILLRCMREKGCKPSLEAQLAIERLPDTFDAWKAATDALHSET